MSAMVDDAISPMESLFVPKAEYAKVVRQALDGSAKAALRLEAQYRMTARTPKRYSGGLLRLRMEVR